MLFRFILVELLLHRADTSVTNPSPCQGGMIDSWVEFCTHELEAGPWVNRKDDCRMSIGQCVAPVAMPRCLFAPGCYRWCAPEPEEKPRVKRELCELREFSSERSEVMGTYPEIPEATACWEPELGEFYHSCSHVDMSVSVLPLISQWF